MGVPPTATIQSSEHSQPERSGRGLHVDIQPLPDEDTVVVSLAGALEWPELTFARTELLFAVHYWAPRVLVVDLTYLGWLDTAGGQLLAALAELVCWRGATLQLVGAQPQIGETVRAAGANTALNRGDEVAAAAVTAA